MNGTFEIDKRVTDFITKKYSQPLSYFKFPKELPKTTQGNEN